MTANRRAILAAGAAWAALPGLGRAQANATIRLGVLTDMAGPYGDLAGPGSVQAVRQAVQDAAGLGLQVEVVSADHQNRPDIAANIARQWFDRDGVDAVIDVPASSAVALAVSGIAREKNKVFLATAPGTVGPDRPAMQPEHGALDLRYLDAGQLHRRGAGEGRRRQLVLHHRRLRLRPFGRAEATVSSRPPAARCWARRFPFPGTTDFSAFLLQRAGQPGQGGRRWPTPATDMINCVKQAAEFGLARRGQRLAALLMFISDVHALGLGAAQGSVCSETFYWDLNDRTRAFTSADAARYGKGAPTMVHAGCYAAVLHYLKAVEDLGAAAAKADGAAAVAR